MQSYFIKKKAKQNKQMGVNRDGHNQSTKTHFDSSVKILQKKKKPT